MLVHAAQCRNSANRVACPTKTLYIAPITDVCCTAPYTNQGNGITTATPPPYTRSTQYATSTNLLPAPHTEYRILSTVYVYLLQPNKNINNHTPQHRHDVNINKAATAVATRHVRSRLKTPTLSSCHWRSSLAKSACRTLSTREKTRKTPTSIPSI